MVTITLVLYIFKVVALAGGWFATNEAEQVEIKFLSSLYLVINKKNKKIFIYIKTHA